MNLDTLGWNASWAAHFAAFANENFTAGRVAIEYKNLYKVYTGNGELLASISGKLRHAAAARADFPAVGDWVVISEAGMGQGLIHALLPRISKFSRKVAGKTTEEQIVAANIDTVFLVNALNKDFNLRRLERYLMLAWDSGANPVIVLSKADLCPDVTEKICETAVIAHGVPVHPVSCVTKTGLDSLRSYCLPGKTVALLGSSGAGKSTLVNLLAGEYLQAVNATRETDDKGRHTTTHRELIPLNSGGLLIDTPGMRELQLWGANEGLSDTFEDIQKLSLQCRFTDCGHNQEPGCAIKEALSKGALDALRYESFVKLQRELAYLERKDNVQKLLENKRKWKKISQEQKNYYK